MPSSPPNLSGYRRESFRCRCEFVVFLPEYYRPIQLDHTRWYIHRLRVIIGADQRMETDMFCNQCEQTSNGTGCVEIGVCGKDPDMQSLQETLLYGVKGMASYANHARRLGKTDERVSAFIEEALFATVTNVNFDLESLFELVLECGQMNLRVMELLDAGHTEKFGKPEPTVVREGTKAGPGILVTGHDLLDLSELLDQTAGTGINVYTHGEMLPANSYPELKKHSHLVGHYGGAWQNQRAEFAEFSGAIVATTNCILIPGDEYKDRLFTTRVTAVPGATRLKGNDFAPVIEAARQCQPLTEVRKASPRSVSITASFWGWLTKWSMP